MQENVTVTKTLNSDVLFIDQKNNEVKKTTIELINNKISTLQSNIYVAYCFISFETLTELCMIQNP